ncbi:MAG TPA: MoxR family ATPase [Firmicutes bacterium]|nr:MoxR family ATPase [Candidatus Fermentithermobacillaceae bacterium]
MATHEANLIIARFKDMMSEVIVGNKSAIELTLVAFLTEGHVLIEDVPGVGKTLLARTFARCLGLDFRRIQFTPDLLPADITGINVFNQKTLEFEFKPGPVFCDILLADEINRATPRTQSSLLECMQERQVTMDGLTHRMSPHFTVLATQNPIELQGTFPLPEAQIDRFLLRIHLGYPEQEEEEEILARFEYGSEIALQQPLITREEVADLKAQAKQVHLSRDIMSYISNICRTTRTLDAVDLGASPRATLSLALACKSYAFVKGRNFVLPDDVKALAVPALAHRLVLAQDASLRGRSADDIILQVLDDVAVPIGNPGREPT